MSKRTQLYRHYDENDNLLYVGISLSAINRLCQHRASPWFDKITFIKIQNFESREEALFAEYEAIQNENPKYNKIHKLHIEEREKQDSINSILENSVVKKTEKEIVSYFTKKLIMNLKEASEVMGISTGQLNKLISCNELSYLMINGRKYISTWGILDFIEYNEKRL